jgi:hypothetical protein
MKKITAKKTRVPEGRRVVELYWGGVISFFAGTNIEQLF